MTSFRQERQGESFFARGVIIVEGDAESILIPVIATSLGIANEAERNISKLEERGWHVRNVRS